MKTEEKNKARELRKNEGMSIKQIAKLLNVSRGSVSKWVKDIELSQEQIQKLQNQNPIFNVQMNGSKAKKEKHHQKRLEYQNSGKLKAQEHNQLHMAGCMLYWAEGAKDRWSCQFANSDLNMLIFFLKFLKECYSITDEKIRIRINCYTDNGLSVQDIEKYWQQNLNMPISCFTKTTADNLSKWSQKKKAKNKLLYGTVTISVFSVELIQNIFGAIQEYGNFHNNFCLD